RVESRETLIACRDRLAAAGVDVKYTIRHEVIESIYFNDPNGYPVEVTWQVRAFEAKDIDDARLTIDAAIALETEATAGGAKFAKIDQVWLRKGHALEAEGV
ncbi:MAG: VOC family protein, partial [Burkholderiales bacterium]